MKKYSKVKTIRLDRKHERLLNECFDKLRVKQKTNFNIAMLNLIEKALSDSKKVYNLQRQIKEQSKLIERLEKQLKKFKIEVPSEPEPLKKKETKPIPEEPKRDIQQPKPRVPQTEPKTPPLAAQKTSISKEPTGFEKQMTPTPRKDDWVVCPDRDDWVRKSVECKQCGEDNFKKFSECYKERTKNPFGPIFKCSKPKPNL